MKVSYLMILYTVNLILKPTFFKVGPIFEECQKEIEKARQSVAKVRLLEKNSEGYINEYFEDIKRQVFLRTEDLKIKIDQYSDNIIKTVDKTQENCIKLSKEENQITMNIAKSKTELDKLIEQFDSLETNAMEFKEVTKSVASLNQEFYQIIDEYNNLLIGNKKYLFQFNELSIDAIFGRLSDSEVRFYIIEKIYIKSIIFTLLKFRLMV